LALPLPLKLQNLLVHPLCPISLLLVLVPVPVLSLVGVLLPRLLKFLLLYLQLLVLTIRVLPQWKKPVQAFLRALVPLLRKPL
jgi:hypothetical protein